MDMLVTFVSWGVPAAIVVLIAVSRYRIKKPNFAGPPLTGIAHVRSLESTGTVIDNRYVCKIGLSVELPDREPYEVTVRQAVHPISLASVQPGLIVRVQVDSANPQKVRIESGPPTHPTSAGSQPPPSAAAIAAAYNQLKQRHGGSSGRWASAAELLATGQRVLGVLKSFAATGNTLRTLGRAATAMPELLDAPQYVIEMELRFPNLAPVVGRSVQSVPPEHVPYLAIGLELPCAVDPADPSHRFVVDWERAVH